MKRLLSLCLAVLLLGCASTDSQQVAQKQIIDGKFAPAPGNGIVVLSMTMQSLAPENTYANLTIQGPAGKQFLYAQIETSMINTPGDESSPAGRVYMLSLPAGQYNVEQANGQWVLQVGRMPEAQMFFLPLNKGFTVKAGEVSYLGSIHLNINFQTTASYSNRFDRDMYDLRKRYGLTDVSNITQQALSGF